LVAELKKKKEEMSINYYLDNAQKSTNSLTITVNRWKIIVSVLAYPRFSILSISGSTKAANMLKNFSNQAKNGG
jgi:hypothetical protein